PTLKFLLENEEQEQVKKQDRLLLILRTVAVIALVLAISRPLLQQSWLKSSGPRNVIIFIDNTASMNQQVGVDTSFRLARKKAAEIAALMPKDTSIAVGCLTDRAETVVEGEQDVTAVASKIKALAFLKRRNSFSMFSPARPSTLTTNTTPSFETVEKSRA